MWLFELGIPLPDNIKMPVESCLHVPGNDQQLQNEIHLSDIEMPDTVTQDEIKPSDSVSNVGSGKSGRQVLQGANAVAINTLVARGQFIQLHLRHSLKLRLTWWLS